MPPQDKNSNILHKPWKNVFDGQIEKSINIKVVKATIKNSDKFPKLMDFDSDKSVEMINLIRKVIQ